MTHRFSARFSAQRSGQVAGQAASQTANQTAKKTAPVLMGVLSACLLSACGSDELGQLREPLTETKAAQINQHDIDGFLTSIKLKNCTFVVGGGTGTFTPSSELSQVLYGDPNGSAHKLSFPVPTITSPSATVDITSLEAEMATTGIALSGANANVNVSFHGLLHVSVTVPVFGKLPADILIRSSSLTVALSYDKATERAKSSAVTSRFDLKTQKCGGSGWCNGIVDGILKTNLATWVEAPLRDAVTKGLDSASATQDLQDLVTTMYNIKDPQATPWTMDAHTLGLSAGAFSFNASRTVP